LIMCSHASAAVPSRASPVRLAACSLELRCCQGITIYPVSLLAKQRGDPTFAEILPRLRCKRCRRPAAPVYLCAGHREHTNGAPADWAIEIVPVAAKPLSPPLRPNEQSKLA
jgi:hypothetical protein